MAVRWKDRMRPASFDGIEFPCVRVSERGGRTVAIHTYPDVPGQEVEDQGRTAATWNVDVVFSPDFEELWGEAGTYAGWVQLKARIDDGGSATLVLPNWGEATAACVDYAVNEAASASDVTEVALTFVEDSLDPFSLLDTTSVDQAGDAEQRTRTLDESLATYEDVDGTPFADVWTTFKLALYDLQSDRDAIESAWLRARSSIRDLVDTYADTLLDPEHWDLMEEIIHLEGDMTDLVTSLDRDFPRFITETLGGETSFLELSVRYYGTKDRAEELHSINSHVSNPTRIPAGTVISYRSE